MQRDRMTWGKVAKWFGCSVIAITVTVFTAWVTSPDPRFNPASFEDQPLVQGLAPLEQAITLAQFRAPNGSTRTLLVLAVLAIAEHIETLARDCPRQQEWAAVQPAVADYLGLSGPDFEDLSADLLESIRSV